MAVDPSNLANPAEDAAQRALEQVFESIREGKNFRLEAGAGAGKTFSLVKALRFVIDQRGVDLLRKNQQVACISYTNVATNEITSRTDGNPAVLSSTIHAFCWSLIKKFQSFLRQRVVELDGWAERLDDVGGLGQRRVEYQLGRRKANPEEKIISISHDDVLDLTVFLMEERKFRDIFSSRFPILFIDEYQDTNKSIAESVVKHFIDGTSGPLIGLFGDSWQKIYRDGCGLIEHENLAYIGKEANFRSVKTIVDVLDRMRPELPQDVQDPDSTGFVRVFHTNSWVGSRLTGGHWKGDLPAEDAHIYLKLVCQLLEGEGWDFSPEKTKILMLTHNVLAAEQNYRGIASSFRYNDSFIKKEDPYISFLIDTLEPMCIAFQQGRHGEMFSILGIQSVAINTPGDKQEWADHMTKLFEVREGGTIGEVIEFLKSDGRPQIPEAVNSIELRLDQASQDDVEESLTLSQITKLKDVSYQEIVALAQYLNQHTPFSTKHGVKGAEFENVLVVLGRGWNLYNWNQFLEWSQSEIPHDKISSYERNRNLFYVCCSRPKERLALLFTQELSATAIITLSNWFGEQNIVSMTI